MADWQAQRRITSERIEALTDELHTLADRRRELALNVELKKASPADLEAIEATMRDKTTALDRARDSMAAIDAREAQEAAKADADARAKAEIHLHDLQAQRRKATQLFTDDLPAVAALAHEVLRLEAEEAQLAHTLGQNGGSHLARRMLADYLTAEFHDVIGHGLAPMPPHAIPVARQRALEAAVS